MSIIKALNIKLLVTGNKKVCLQDYSGKNLVIYFYPKDDTPGCVTEGKDFSNLYKQFCACNTQIVGVSRDTILSHENFKKKYNYPFDLISDPNEQLCKAFSVLKQKNNFGTLSFSIIRSTFVLNSQSEIIKTWQPVKVKGHAQQVLEFIKTV